ncbi:MAG: TRAP transporter substrate-binding protein DctP [Marinobacter sp.]|uniref:TRAP transporter substrate-binding protein DctP n=1 Tax=Marinobacter sp. TaxID=50741 RepID=UPI0034A092D7
MTMKQAISFPHARKTLGRTFAAALLAGSLAAPVLADEPEYEFTMGAIVSPGDIYGKMTTSVPERISEATNGKVEVTVSDSLIAASQVASAVRDGRLPMSAALHTYLAGDEPRMGIFNLPGLIENIDDYQKVRDAFWAEDVARIWDESWNAKVFAEGAWCNTRLFSKDPIHSIEDFEGKRLRVHNPQTASLIESLGGKGTPMPMTEIVPALERGVIDGVFTSACVGETMDIWREAPNVQDWGIAPVTGWAILMNNDEWEKLPSDIQEQIQGAMDELQAEAFGGYKDFVQKAMDEMEEKGAKVWSASEEERAELNQEKYTQGAYDSWYQRAEEVGFDGPAYVQQIRDVLEK